MLLSNTKIDGVNFVGFVRKVQTTGNSQIQYVYM
jgi:hypothetical protein